MDQIPQYPNTDTGFQEYTQQFESYANPTSSFSSNFYVAQAQAHTDVHSSQFQPQSYDPYHQPTPRISRVFSEPTFPANDIQSHSYTASSIPQRHRAFSTGANPYNFGTPTSVAGQSSTPFNDGQGISRLYAYELPRTGQDIIYSESGDLEETKWPVEISMPDQYLAQQTQEQPYFDVFRPEAFLPEELGQTSYEVQGGHEAVYRTAGRSGQMSVEDSLRSYNTPDLVDLNPETSYMHPEMSSYMRYPGANTYVNYPAVDIPREVRFSAQQSQAGAPYPNSALNLQSHTDSYTLSYPQPQVPLRQSVEPQPNSPSNRSIPTPPTGSQLFQSNRPITPVYVDVGVQTDPWQPTTRLATKEAGHKLGGTQTIMKGGKAKRILPAARSSNQSQPVPKDTPQAKNKLALAQLKVQPQTPPESRLPHASSGSHRLSAASTSEVLSLEGYQRPQSIGSSHRMVPHDSKRLSQSHTGSSQVPDSSLLVMNDHAPTSSIPPAPPGVAITASSNSLARPVQQVQALPSPCTPDLATHQTFDGFVASTRTSTPLITDMLPRVSRPDHSSHEASFASTHRISGAHLPTPDPSPAGGMNWQLYFPSGPQFEQEPGRVTAAPAPVYEYHQASDKPRVDDSTVRQGNNQPHQAGFHVAVPFIRVHDAEGMLAGPGGLLGQDYTQPGTSVDAAPHRSPQNHFEYRATQPEVSEFSESSVQERNNLVDRPPTLQSQHDPTWQRYQSVRKMESYVEGKQQSTPIVSQLDIPRLHQTHPELVARGQQPQAQISILKRERSASETSLERRTKRQREESLGQSSSSAEGSVPEPPAPQVALTNSPAFSVKAWMNLELSQAAPETRQSMPLRKDETLSRNHCQQIRKQDQDQRRTYATDGTMGCAPLSYTTPLPTDDCSAQIAMDSDTRTCPTASGSTAHTPCTNTLNSARTDLVTASSGSRRQMETDSERLIDLDGSPNRSGRLDSIDAAWTTTHSWSAPQAGVEVADNPYLPVAYISARQGACQEVLQTTVDHWELAGRGREFGAPMPAGSTATAVLSRITRLPCSSSVPYPQSPVDLQMRNIPPAE